MKKFFSMLGFPIQQRIVFKFKISLIEWVDGKQLKVVMDDVKVFPHDEDNLIDLDQEAFVVGLAAFIGGEQISSLFEIGFEELELVFKVKRSIRFHDH